MSEDVYKKALLEIRDSTFRSAVALRGIADRALTQAADSWKCASCKRTNTKHEGNCSRCAMPR